MFPVRARHLGVLAALPLCVILFCVFGPFETETVTWLAGLSYDVRPGPLDGFPTVDANQGWTAFAPGKRAALDLLAGRLPLWNHFEGLGAPLLGAMQPAALFPPTLLLALPHGQEIEQALLQFIAGAGAFLFFRRYGLGVLAALTGALLYEVNGVFAWLRNAVFNPVAFLPWLFLAIECLYAAAGQGVRQRLGFVVLGALAAALAVYAGFPEQVYFYAPLLTAWAIYRGAMLAGRARWEFLAALTAAALLALAVSAPVLTAFAAYLKEAATGPHDAGFYGQIPHAGILLQYLAPYVYGPIFMKPVSVTWPDIGGYTGFALAAAALAGLWTGRDRGARLILGGWIAIALGVSHGVPGIYQAFMALPLASLAAGYRYLNAGWIFAAIFLAALFIDRMPALPRARRVTAGAAGAVALLALGAASLAWPLLTRQWAEDARFGQWGAASSMAMLAVACALCFARSARAVAAILVAEAVVWFALPFLAHPRAARIDSGAIAFLRQNLGYQRIAGAGGQGLGPNYGAAFGIANLNYLDLPVPRATVAYIARHLDPTVTMDFIAPDGGETERLAMVKERADAYARAGVKYLLADAAFNAQPLLPNRLSPEPRGDTLLRYLAPGESLEIAAAEGEAGPVAGLLVRIGERSRNADGRLAVELCSGGQCGTGTADIRSALNYKPLFFRLDRSVEVAAGAGFTLRIRRDGGEGRLALALSPTEAAVTGVQEGYAPTLRAIPWPAQLPVYAGPRIAIYAVPGARGYFSADGCDLTPRSRNQVAAVCAHAATLTRLEVLMEGWTARVNGAPATLGAEDGAFQTVALPAGRSEIAFSYAPRGFRAALTAALVALAVMTGLLFWRGKAVT